MLRYSYLKLVALMTNVGMILATLYVGLTDGFGNHEPSSHDMRNGAITCIVWAAINIAALLEKRDS